MLSEKVRHLTPVLLDPLLLICLLTLVLAIWRWLGAARKISRRGLVLGLLPLSAILLSTTPAIVNRMVGYFEALGSDQSDCSSQLTPVVVAGGGIDSGVQSPMDFSSLHEPSLRRTLAAWRLAMAQSNMTYPIVLTGGGRHSVSEAAAMKQLLVSLRIDPARLYTEEKSVSTASNARHTAALFEERGWGVGLRLVTSALHMVRAKESFESQGFEVCSISGVDVQAIEGVPVYALLPQTTALLKFKKFLHEVVGLAGYRLQRFLEQ